jgi:hypothetical protein
MEKLTHIDFALGPGGWVKTHWRRGGPERTAWVRFEEQPSRGRKRANAPAPQWRVAELRVTVDDTTENLRAIPLHRIELAFNALGHEMSAELRQWLNDEVPGDLDKAIRKQFEKHPRKKLKRPARRKLDDAFFRDVAFAYREALIRGLNPGMTIAEDAGVPHSTAARWIAQAREKDYLPKTRQGKVTRF